MHIWFTLHPRSPNLIENASCFKLSNSHADQRRSQHSRVYHQTDMHQSDIQCIILHADHWYDLWQKNLGSTKLIRIFRLGFLLGKYVSDRHYKIRQLQQPEYVTLIKQFQTLCQSIEVTAHNITETKPSYTFTKYNRILWDEVAACTDTAIEQSYHEKLDAFVAKLVNNELNIAYGCLKRMSNLLNEFEAE